MTSYDFVWALTKVERITIKWPVVMATSRIPRSWGPRTVAMSWFGRHQCGITYFLRATVPMGLTSKESIKGLAVILAIVHMNSRSRPARYMIRCSQEHTEGVIHLHRR